MLHATSATTRATVETIEELAQGTGYYYEDELCERLDAGMTDRLLAAGFSHQEIIRWYEFGVDEQYAREIAQYLEDKGRN